MITKAITSLVLLSTFSFPLSALAQGTAFTYQGLLNDGGTPANGSYDLRFKLFLDPLGNTPVATTVVTGGVPIANGLFSATLDFGAGVFNGSNYWLEVGVKTNGAGAYVKLSRLRAVTPTPYALFAETVGSGGLAAGTYANAVTLNNAANSFSGSFAGDGAGVSNVNALTLNGRGAGSFWQLGGNAVAAGQFLGSTNDQPVEIWADGTRALRLEPNPNGAPNVIGGAPVNVVEAGVVGATIGGGRGNAIQAMANYSVISGGSNNAIRVNALHATVGGGYLNKNSAQFGTVAGGSGNTNGGYAATIAGGQQNTNTGYAAAIGGGQGNLATNQSATVAGGQTNLSGGLAAAVGGGGNNRATGSYATVGGGSSNSSSGRGATVPGGSGNTAAGTNSFAGGTGAQAVHSGSFVWSDGSGGNFSSTASNQFAVRAGGGVLLAGNIQLGTGTNDYHRLQVGGGNASGFLYGWGDGIHVGYNSYADASSSNRVLNASVATSRISVGDGSIILATGGVGVAPTIQRLVVDDFGVTVNGPFYNFSDRTAKQDFAPVSPGRILDQVLQLPLSQWSYTSEPATRHLGPMAQDFHARFKLGADDRHIAPLDQGGVALAAIQGLNEKVEARTESAERRMQKLKAENAALRERLEKLEQIIQSNLGHLLCTPSDGRQENNSLTGAADRDQSHPRLVRTYP